MGATMELSDLHPMGIWEMVGRVFRLTVHKYIQLVGLLLLIFLPAFALMAVTLREPDRRPFLNLLALFALEAAYFYYYAAATLLVSYHLVGVRVGWTQIARPLKGKVALRILGVGLLTLLLIGVAVVPGLILLAVFPGAPILGAIAAVIPAGYIVLSAFFATPAVVLEAATPRQALRRSWALAAGHRWRLLGEILAFFVVFFSGILVVGAPFVVAGVPEAVLQLVMYPLVLPAAVIFPVLAYYDVRSRKEHFNVERLRMAL